MNFIRSILLLVLSGVMSGCAETSDVSDNPPPEQVPTHDDTHGWGANLQGVGSGRQ